MPLYIAQSGDLEGCNACLTDGQTLKDRATQLFIKYKSGALVTQFLQLGIIKLNLSYDQTNLICHQTVKILLPSCHSAINNRFLQHQLQYWQTHQPL